MKRDQVIAKLQQQVTALQELILQLKESKNLDFNAIELALFENKLIAFYDEILKIKSGKSIPAPSDVKLDSTPAPKSAEPKVDVDSIKSEFESLKEQFAKQHEVEKKPIITFEPEQEEEKSEENIDAELEGLMDIAAKELIPADEPKAPPVESNQEETDTTAEAPKQQNEIESKPKTDLAQEEKTAEPKQQPEQKPIEDSKPIAKETPSEEKPKPTSLNERHKQVQGKPSLLDKLASNRKPDLSRQMAGKPIKDLKKAITLNEQIKYQRELFESDKRAYRKAIDFINKCNTYSEARSYVEHELAAEFSNCKEGNPTFDSFMGLVKRRFI
jgi:hypothetical protein